MKRELKILEFKNKDSYLVKVISWEFADYSVFYNGKYLSKNIEYILPKGHKFTYSRNRKVLSHYEKDGIRMETSVYENYLQKSHIDNCSTKQEALKAFNAREAIKGFEKVYVEPEVKELPFEVIGYLEHTNSPYISTAVKPLYQDKNANIYHLDTRRLAFDTLKRIQKECASVSNFNIKNNFPDSIKYTEINNEYVFTNSPLNRTLTVKSFLTLEKALKEEKRIINIIEDRCYSAVYKNELHQNHKIILSAELETILKLDDIDHFKKSINILLNKVKDYESKIIIKDND